MKSERLEKETKKGKSQQAYEDAGINPELDWMIRAGITDGRRCRDYATREETALMIAAALRYWTSCVFRMLDGEPGEI
ncbi:MAG: hypothetical protein E7440_04490 [Ruminococcaceae bacterium]|nr:hypothetical protein [Oscillospiraceae bacterium]